MATGKEYAAYLKEQLSHIEDIRFHSMMGEYIIYYREKVIGGIYDNRFLVKPVSTAKTLMPSAPYEIPYPGAKEMILVENTNNKEFLARLFSSMYDELPAVKK